LDAVRHLQRRGERPTKIALADALRDVFGYDIPRALTYHTTMLAWLKKAGLLDPAAGSHVVDEARFAQLAGVRQEVREGWEQLTRDQKHFAKALGFLSPTHGQEWLPARDVYEHARQRYGSRAPEDQLAKQVFDPLERGGWLERSTGSAGRGGKSGYVRPTAQLLEVPANVMDDAPTSAIPLDLRPRLQEPLDRIRGHLKSRDKRTKGIALELLALRMVMDLALSPKGFRLRSAETGGAEVDLTAEGAHLLFSRWIVQCKNTPSVNLHDLAKEVGMATLLKAHVVVLVTTGKFARTVEIFARQVAETTPLQVVLVPSPTLDRYLGSKERSMGVLADYFRKVATDTMQLKDPQRNDAVRESPA
jgi:Restriction endonuclease